MVKHLLSRFPGQFALSVSCTTRAPRGQEQDGREYYFVSREAFEQHIANGDFIEYEQVYEGLYYGTLRSEIERIQSAGMTAVFDIGGSIHRAAFGGRTGAPPARQRRHLGGDDSEAVGESRHRVSRRTEVRLYHHKR